MTTEDFRAALSRLGLSQAALARLLAELGDTAQPSTILRRIERWIQGTRRVPGEMAALLTLLERQRD